MSLRSALAAILCLPGPASAQDWAATQEAMRGSLVYLEAEGFDTGGNPVTSTATGFIIHPRGLILTVEHFLNQTEGFVENSFVPTARLGNKFGFPVEIRPVDIQLGLDLALFALPDTGMTYRAACLHDGSEIAVRTEIGTSGFPSSVDYYPTTGLIENLSGHPENPLGWQTNLTINPGQSGSPVYLADGNVVAIAQSVVNGAETLSYVMPIAAALSALATLADCEPSGETPQPIELTEAQQQCIEVEYDRRITMAFTQGGGVRCPGGGCFLQSSDCNDRASTLRYAAPVGYRIDSYLFNQISSNYASNGPLQDERDELGITSLSILLRCEPSSRPGAGGGWSEGELRGTIRHTAPRELINEAREVCGVPPL